MKAGHLEVVEYLLENRAQAQTEAKINGETPLMRLFYKNGNESFIELLLRKANVNTKDDDGNTPLLKAMKFKNIDYVKLLVKHPNTDIFVQNYKSQNVFDLEKEGSDLVYR